MTKLFRPSMFIVSFIPLGLAIIIYNIYNIVTTKDFIWLPRISLIIIIVFNVLAIIDVLVEIKKIDNKPHINKTIIYAKKDKSAIPTFILSVALPLVAFDFESIRDYFLLFVFIVPIFIICQHNNVIFPNLLLMLLKYNYYECEFKEFPSVSKVVISKTDFFEISQEQTVNVYQVNNDFYIS